MFDDEPPTESPRPDSLLRAEDGMITVLSVVTVFGFAVLASLVASIGTAVNRKIEAQNAADAVAMSCSVQRARTLNAVTAVNHLTGELLAVVVLQESFGGWKAGSGEARDTEAEDDELRTAKEIAPNVKTDFDDFSFPKDIIKFFKVFDESTQSHDFAAKLALALAGFNEARTPAYNSVKKSVKSDNALLDAHRELKKTLALLYRLKAKALLMIACKPIPFGIGEALYVAGRGLYQALTFIEEMVKFEWETLGWIETFAKETGTVRNQIYKLIPNLQEHSKNILAGKPASLIPGVSNPVTDFLTPGSKSLLPDTADAVAKRNRATGVVFPRQEPLKTKQESVRTDKPSEETRVFWIENDGEYKLLQEYTKDDGMPPERPESWSPAPEFASSQLIRATYPWVNYHRRKVFDITKWLIFSDFPKHYRNWSTEITLRRGQAYYTENPGAGLFVLADLENSPRKDGALWLNNTRAAEHSFALVGFARQAPPMRWTTRFQPATNPGGTVAFAQSLLYNANPRVPGSDSRFQPVTGYDTLNWNNEGGDPVRSAALEWPWFKKDLSCPRVKLNWQTKLVPVTRLGEAVPVPDGEFQSVLNKLDAFSPLAHGH